MTGGVGVESGWFDVVVRSATRDAGNVLILDLERPDGALPSFTAGSHVAIHCGEDLIRHYSLFGPRTSPTSYRLGVKVADDSRGGSKWIGESARLGQTMRISFPRNNFPLVPGIRDYLFLSGGIGITPLLSMLEELRDQGRRARLVHLCRSAQDLAFAPWLQDLGTFHDVHVHCDSAVGSLYDIVAELERAADDTAVYCCGPTPMMNIVRSFGVQRSRIDDFHFEFFASAGPVDATDASAAFTAVLHSTGREVNVAAGETLLAALRRAGVSVESECEEGVCGTCTLRVVSGLPDHRDFYLTSSERAANDVVLACVSRCMGTRFELDL